jgi:hypothetical protein
VGNFSVMINQWVIFLQKLIDVYVCV